MWRYRSWLPVAASSVPVTLGEGLTPLLQARSAPTGLKLLFKNETVNPTGSQKDRALSVSITKAVELEHRAVMLYSDGSAALSSAAYAARAGLQSIIVVPRGTADYRLLPLLFYNSTILEYQGDSTDALSWTRDACRTLDLYETTTYRRANPYGAEGPKTISYEIVEQLNGAPAWVIVPVGGGGTISGIWRGFQELYTQGVITSCPRLAVVLPSGYSLLQKAYIEGASTEDDLRALMPSKVPSTIQAKIAMSLPPDGIEAIHAIRESDGIFFYATDRQVIQGQKILGRQGIFAEPSAAGVMIAVEALASMGIDRQHAVVAVITGSGFREVGAVAGCVALKRRKIEPATGIDDIRSLLYDAQNRTAV